MTKGKYLLIVMGLFFIQILFGNEISKRFLSRDSNLKTSEISFQLDEINLNPVDKNGVIYTKIEYRNEGEFVEPGKPDLPRFTRMVAIENEGSVRFNYQIIEERKFENILIYPRQSLQNESELPSEKFYIDNDFYEKDEIYPSKLVQVGKPAILRDYRVVNLTINPFRYNPLKRELTVVTEIKVELITEGKGGVNIKKYNRPISRFFEPLYKSNIINYEQIRKRDNYQNPKYLFIYSDENEVESEIQDLIEWKHRKGFEVVAASTDQTGSSINSIRNFIEDEYENSDNPPEFVCLVGDADVYSYEVPTGHESTNSGDWGEGDHYYTLLEGNDILADVHIGRLSFNSINQLKTLISKIFKYEITPYTDNTNWFEKAILVGDPSTSGYSCVTTKKSIKEMMQLHAPNFSFQEVYSGSFASHMSNGLNEGRSYFNYRGYYGTSGWDNYDIDNLNNGYMMPFAAILTCGTGGFEGSSDCNSERLAKVGTTTIPQGAIGAIGTATLSTHTCFNNCVDAGIFDGIFKDKIFNMGGALTRGKLSLYTSYPDNPNNAVSAFSYWNNLIGDPGLDLWSAVPKEFIVEYDDASIGQNYFTVTVKNDMNFPVQDAWVTILKEDEIFETDFTNENGLVNLPLEYQGADDIKITVSKHNFVPYLNTFNVIQQNAFIGIKEYEFDDDNSGSSSGNDDGLVNPGETVELNIDFKNFGLATLDNVEATLSTNVEGINVLQNDMALGTVESGELVSSEEAFIFELGNQILGGTELNFQVIISADNGYEWIDYIETIVSGANLAYQSYLIHDDNNDILDPGETADLEVTLKNIGSINSEVITARLNCEYDYIEIQDSLALFNDIQPGDTDSNTSDYFTLYASSNIVKGSQIPFQLVLNNENGFNQSISFILEIGSVSEHDPLGPDNHGYYCYDNYDTSYDIAPVYNWYEIDPDQGGNGEILNLNDDGSDEGDLESIVLPFDIRFYAKDYNQITVCSNGWISPGYTEQEAFMNWPIPGPLGPSPMIAPFWDDLLVTSSSNVCYYHNEEEKIFIVEWSNLKNEGNSSYTETFQVLLRDLEYYPTVTGDTEILFQYKTINNVDQGSYTGGYVNHGEYATVGLEDDMGTMGLQYTYSDEYPTAAHELEDNLALLFTTNGSITLEPPIAEINTTNLNFTIQENSQETQNFIITNNGGSNLFYSITEDYFTDNASLGKDMGGPDDYGYRWIDSNELNGPNFNWVDISDIGTQVEFEHNDVGTDLMPIGFTFNFYGNDYDEFRINPNGWIGFGEDNDDWSNDALPNSEAPKPAIMPFWDDLFPAIPGETENPNSGDVYYWGNSDSLVVMFNDVIHYSGNYDGEYDFEVILYADGHFIFQYNQVSGDTNSATIGAQNEDATDAIQVSYNTQYVENNLAVKFVRIIDWIDVDTVSGIVLTGESQNVNVYVNTSELNLGEYNCNLLISTNDPEHQDIFLPVQLVVSNDFPEIEVSTTEIDFGSVNIGEIYTDSLIVSNSGNQMLNISEIYTTNDVFSVNSTEIELQPAESYSLEISFLSQIEGNYQESLHIISNDNLTPDLEIELMAQAEEVSSNQPENVNFVNMLSDNYPNPFYINKMRNSFTTLKFSIKEQSKVTLEIYNIKGKKVKTIINDYLKPDKYKLVWDGLDENNNKVASGIYLYRLKTDKFSRTKKMIILK